MNAIQILVIGLISTIGLVWQVELLRKDSKDRTLRRLRHTPLQRLKAPIKLGFVIVLGVIVYCVIVFLDPRKDSVSASTYLVWIFKAVSFAIVMGVKSYLGPLAVSFVLSSEAYAFLEYGEWHAIPLLSAFADWVFEFAPGWASTAYLVVQTVYSFTTSLVDTIADASGQ
jgi:hypothetical protein